MTTRCWALAFTCLDKVYNAYDIAWAFTPILNYNNGNPRVRASRQRCESVSVPDAREIGNMMCGGLSGRFSMLARNPQRWKYIKLITICTIARAWAVRDTRIDIYVSAVQHRFDLTSCEETRFRNQCEQRTKNPSSMGPANSPPMRIGVLIFFLSLPWNWISIRRFFPSKVRGEIGILRLCAKLELHLTHEILRI